MVDKWLNSIHMPKWPSACLMCRSPSAAGLDLCQPCMDELPFLVEPCCPVCALPVSYGGMCGQCLKKRPSFARTVAVFGYTGAIQWLIKRLKFSHKLVPARILGELMGERLPTMAPAPWPEAIVPVPLHTRRLRHRGFNQAIELARPVAARLSLPIDWECCERVVATAEQSSLSLKTRRRNLKGVFQVVRKLDYKHVAIIDDVMTTGTTANELAKTLRRSGVERVDVWVCARTLGYS